MTSTLLKDPVRQVEVSELQPGEEGEWDRFVTSSPEGVFYQLTGWKSIVERVLGHRCFLLAARSEGKITGVFPISWVRSRILAIAWSPCHWLFTGEFVQTIKTRISPF